jgi:hypothetical protein
MLLGRYIGAMSPSRGFTDEPVAKVVQTGEPIYNQLLTDIRCDRVKRHCAGFCADRNMIWTQRH